MRLALVSREFPPENSKGGIGTQTWLKARGMVARGHRVTVITRSWDADRHRSLRNGIDVIHIPGAESQIPLRSQAVEWLTYSTRVAITLEDLQDNDPFDLIDFPEWGGEGYIYLLNRSPESCPVVVHIHGPLAMFVAEADWPEPGSALRRVGLEMEGTSLRSADALISSSRYSAQICRAAYQLGSKEIPVLHSGVDTETFSPSGGTGREPLTVLFVGRISASKGVFELLQACAANLPRIDHRLRFVGRLEEGLEERLLGLCDRLQAPQDFLQFTGPKLAAELAAEYRAADIFAAPSWCEGGPGFVYLEAMACGLPVIGCRSTGVEEIIEHGKNGFLVPKKDVHSLQKAVYLLLQNSGLRREMGDAGRRKVTEQFNVECCLSAIEDFYRKQIQLWGEGNASH